MRKPIPYSQPLIIKMTSHKFPRFIEKPGKDWIYYGENNDYPFFLLDLFYKCSKHNAIVNGKTKYIAGGGWGDAGNTVINSEEESLDDLTWKIVCDMEIYGGFAMEVIWTKGGNKAEFRHVDFSKIRTNKDLTKFYYTKKWCRADGYPIGDPTQNDDWQEYMPFDETNKGEAQLIYYKCYSPGLDIYPLPEYKASLQYIELEFQIANYWYNRVKNGFMPSAILNFYMGQPTDNEMKKLEETIKAKFTSTDNAGQFILNFAPNKDSAADIQQITPPELGQEYEALNTTLQTEIFTGHGVTNGMLFGIKEAGQLGGRTELIEANELFQNRYVNPKQLKIEMFFTEYVFPFIGVKEAKLVKQEPIGYMFSESIMIKYLPERAIAEMVAKKMGIDLKKFPEHTKEMADRKKAETQSKQQFSKEKILLAKLKAKGKKRKIKEVIYFRPVTFEMSRNLKASEEELRMTFAKKGLPIIIGAPTKPINIKPQESPDEIISVVYTYEWIEGFTDADLTTSRDFCIEMRAETNDGMTWTREDIDTLDNDAPTEVDDVWENRGGWYNDNGTPVPHCRHQWFQKVIREIR